MMDHILSHACGGDNGEKTFFDAHLHAFNLSHPSFSTFARCCSVPICAGILSPCP